jgi:hypothetical protein
MIAMIASTRTPTVPMPTRMATLPRERGYVVPWFVERLPDGHYDFRIMDSRKLARAVERRLCWLCGHGMPNAMTFVLGPMCAINRTSSEPPCHLACAEYAVQACPFLTQQEVRRRTTGLPDGLIEAAGIPIDRQPGVALLWTTRRYQVYPVRHRPGGQGQSDVGGGVLFELGDPLAVSWWREGRPATRAEVLASIDSGLPLLEREAAAEGRGAVAALARQVAAVAPLLPAEAEPGEEVA